jgi:fatty acid desaturase
MTAEQIKARLENHAASLAEREARQRIEDEAWRRAQRHSRTIDALIVVGLVAFLASLVAIFRMVLRG